MIIASIRGFIVKGFCSFAILTVITGLAFGQAARRGGGRVDLEEKNKQNIPAVEMEKLPDGQGPLFRAQVQLGKLINFGADGTAMVLDKSQWPKEDKNPPKNDNGIPEIKRVPGGGIIVINGRIFGIPTPPEVVLFMDIQQLYQPEGKESSMRNNGEFYCSFKSREMNGNINYTNDMFTMSLEENIIFKRTLELQNKSNNYISLTLTLKSEKKEILSLQQDDNGKISIKIQNEEKSAEDKEDGINLKADSFVQLYLDNQKVMEDVVYPVLRKLGIGVEASIESEKVRNKALTLILLMDKADADKAKQLIKQLDADNFESREAASKALDKDFKLYEKSIIDAASDNGNTAEVIERLNKILKAHPSEDNSQKIIQSLNLMDNPMFLIRLLSDANEQQKPLVVATLETVTGQKFGADIAAWKKWLATSPQTGGT